MKPNLFSGARGEIQFTRTDASGKAITTTLAFVTDVSISVSQNLRPSFVIGEIGPKSIEPLGSDANASIGRIIPINQTAPATTAATNTATATPAATGTKPPARADMNAIELGLEPITNQLLSSDTVEIVIYDKGSQADGKNIAIGSLKYARFAGKSMSMSSTDLATERYNFVGIWDSSYSSTQTGDEIGYKTPGT
jgi:hypothetical protein